MSYLQKAKTLYAMIGQGQMLEAFEKYYADDVVMVEANGETREGKEANREFEKQWMAGVLQMHDGGATAITSDEENAVTMVETWADVTFQDGNRMKIEEVCVQRWRGEQIFHERFYYNMPG